MDEKNYYDAIKWKETHENLSCTVPHCAVVYIANDLNIILASWHRI